MSDSMDIIQNNNIIYNFIINNTVYNQYIVINYCSNSFYKSKKFFFLHSYNSIKLNYTKMTRDNYITIASI